ncbi:MAG: hypothetical protein QXU50_03030 [Candidatus Korarchaeum sp.]
MMGAPEEGKEFRYTAADLMGIRKMLEGRKAQEESREALRGSDSLKENQGKLRIEMKGLRGNSNSSLGMS